MNAVAFPFRFHPLFRAAAVPFGIRADSACVEVVGEEVVVAFGRWRVRTTLSNVVAAEVTGPYAWPKVIGPPHLSFADRGLTFATNPDEGVCLRFAEPVRGIDPWGLVRHPSVTLTVRDPAGLAELLDLSRHDLERVHGETEHPTVADLAEAMHDDLRSLSAAELRRRAQDRGVTGASRRSKAELIELLEPDVSTATDSGSDDLG